MVRKLASGDFNLQHTLTFAIIKHKNRSIELFRFVINSAKTCQYSSNLIIYHINFIMNKQVEIQVCRETIEIMEKHQRCTALECHNVAEILVLKDKAKYLSHI